MDMTIKHSACPMCKSDRILEVFKILNPEVLKRNQEIYMYKCSDCNQVFLNPWYEHSEFGDEYRIFTAKELAGAIEDGLVTSHYEPVSEKLLNAYPEMIHLATKWCKGDSVADLGAGIGLSSLALNAAGIQTVSFEVNSELAECGANYLNLNMQNVDLHNYDGPKFKFAILNSVIEHAHDPEALLTSIRNNILEPQGLIIVTAPNIESSQTISEGPAFSQFHSGHVWYFSEATLNVLMKNCGFHLIEYYRPGFNLSGVDKNVEYYLNMIHNYNTNFYGAVAGVWIAE